MAVPMADPAPFAGGRAGRVRPSYRPTAIPPSPLRAFLTQKPASSREEGTAARWLKTDRASALFVPAVITLRLEPDQPPTTIHTMPGHSASSLGRVSDATSVQWQESEAGASLEKPESHDQETYLRKEREAEPAPVALPEADLLGVDDFPDGGLRAWLVLFGVSAKLSKHKLVTDQGVGSRRSVIRLLREHPVRYFSCTYPPS
jgi:hypothetical protein